jgi:hypothetical protein
MADGPKRIAVAGDLIIDWNLARAQESDRSATLWDPNYKAQAFSQLGGAALLCKVLQQSSLPSRHLVKVHVDADEFLSLVREPLAPRDGDAKPS